MLVAGLCSLGGVFWDRLLFVSAAQIAPLTAATGTVSHPYAAYTPSPVEIGILVGAGAFMAFVYTLAERYLDLSESDVHVGYGIAPIVRRLRDAIHRDAPPVTELAPTTDASAVSIPEAGRVISGGGPEDPAPAAPAGSS
jgi:hypothetical protein